MSVDTENRIFSAYSVPLILMLVGLVLSAALLNGQMFLSILCILVFTLMAGARLWSRLSMAGVHSSLKIDKQKMFPGETLDLSAEVSNNKILPIWMRVHVGLDRALQLPSGETEIKKDSGLLWYQNADFSWQVTALQRGVHRIGPVTLEIGDLLGFYPKLKQTTDFHDIIVYPHLVRLNPLQLPRRDFFGIPGVKSPVEDPVYIHGTRDYQYLRPARFIHWKASARQNRLMEKLCEPAEQEKILILIHTDHFDSDPLGEIFEHTLEAAASLAVNLDRMRFAVGLATNGHLKNGGRATLKISRSPGLISNILETLARLEPFPAEDMITILQRGGTLPWGVTAVCFSYRLDETSLTINRYFQQRKIPIVMVFCDPQADLKEAGTQAGENIYRLEDLKAKGFRAQ